MWNIRFSKAIKWFDFLRNANEPYVYKRVSGSMVMIVVFYVDDILLIEMM